MVRIWDFPRLQVGYDSYCPKNITGKGKLWIEFHKTKSGFFIFHTLAIILKRLSNSTLPSKVRIP